jgi:hypothetical protein
LEEAIMPSFSRALKRDIDRVKFVEEQAGAKKKPKKRGVSPEIGVLFGARSVRLVIREAAINLRQVIITYKKITTGERKMYRVAPYSYRYRRVRIGLTRLLFAYDMEDKHIKGFVLKNISKIVILDKGFRPKWEVEL